MPLMEPIERGFYIVFCKLKSAKISYNPFHLFAIFTDWYQKRIAIKNKFKQRPNN